MAGHKFGAAGNPSLTWMMNVGVPATVADIFREHAHRVVLHRLRVPVRAGGRTLAPTRPAPATPPAGDYANSCVGRERMFDFGSRAYGTPGRMVRLSYARHPDRAVEELVGVGDLMSYGSRGSM